jgi:hypothetical protein
VKLVHSFIFLIFIGILAGSPLSHSASGVKQPCQGDFQQFCRFEEEQDQEHLSRCLRKNQKKLSTDCKTYLPELLKKLENYQVACAEDLKKFCPQLSFKNRFRAFGCLRSNETELSEECQIHIHPQHPFWNPQLQEQLRDDL